jgi:hypothetical protein
MFLLFVVFSVFSVSVCWRIAGPLTVDSYSLHLQALHFDLSFKQIRAFAKCESLVIEHTRRVAHEEE